MISIAIKNGLPDTVLPDTVELLFINILKLFVRDDGTVDWDGAIQSGREVARFGQVCTVVECNIR